MTEQKTGQSKDIPRPKYASLRIGLGIIRVFSYVMLGISIVFFIIGLTNIGDKSQLFPVYLVYLPISFLLALCAVGILMQARVVQLQQDIELNTRRMADLLEGFSQKAIAGKL